jgi:hypothetical protein
MRKVALGVLLAVAGMTAGVASPSDRTDACAVAPAAAPAGLPWPVVLQTNCGRFTIGTDGRVVLQPGRSLPVPAGATWSPLDGRWWKVADRHLLVGRWHETLWRSFGTFRRSGQVGAFTLGGNLLAFSYGYGSDEQLYVARLDGPERLLAAREYPLAWTPTAQLLTQSENGSRLYARRADGTGRRILTARLSMLAIAPDGTLFFLAGGRLMRTNGGRPAVLTPVARLGLTRTPELEALGPLVALRDRHRLVVLHADGSLFGSTPLPRWKKRTDGVSSAVTADAPADTVAFTATDQNTALGSTGTETTFVLRAGDTKATPLHREPVDFKICERMAELEWHEHWLLYSASEGNVVAIDAHDPSRAFNLSTFARALPGTQDDDSEGGRAIDASWAEG